jgi:molybdate transport system substrate-binding protein
MSLAVERSAAAQESLRILATGVFATTLHALADPFEAASGYKLDVSIANAGQIASRIAAGEPADVVMTSAASLQTLAKQGAIGPYRVAIGNMRLGVAVPPGTAAPDLTTPEAFRSLLVSAVNISYIDPNGGGTSGPFFEHMFMSLGVADAVHAKALLGKDGAEVVRAVASGNAAVGMTQASEIIGGDGVVFAGYIPASLNLTTPYSAAVTAQSTNAKTASAFLEFITGPIGSERLRQAGWDIDR